MEKIRRYIYRIDFLCGTIAGHYYIGRHETKARWDSYTGSGVVCRSYFKKYGAKKGDTYTKTILEDWIDSTELLKEREAFWVGDLWETDPLCENLMPGGLDGCIMKGEKNPNYNKPRSEETKKKISDSNKGKPKTPEHRAQMYHFPKGNTPWNKGKKYENKKDSESMKIKWQDPEYRNKCVISHIGQKSCRAKPVVSIVIKTGEVEHWDSARQAGFALGNCSGNITSCLNGRRTEAFGRTWSYE